MAANGILQPSLDEASPLVDRPGLRTRKSAAQFQDSLDEELEEEPAVGQLTTLPPRRTRKMVDSDSEEDFLKNDSEDEEYTPKQYGRGRGKRIKLGPGRPSGNRLFTATPIKFRRPVADLDAKKEFFDDLSKMCLCRCNICNKTFLHHRMLKHIERTHKQGSKDKFVFLTHTFYRCKLCDAEILFSFYNIGQHVKRCHKMALQDYKDQVKDAFTGDLDPLAEQDDEDQETTSRVFSEDLTKMCLVKCNLCEEVAFFHLLKLHVVRDHKETMEVLGKIQFVKKTYYRCKICDAEMLFHFDAMTKHYNTVHKMTLKAYRTEYDAFTGQAEYNSLVKRTTGFTERIMRRELRKSAVQEPGLEDRWRSTLEKGRKYFTDNMSEMCLRRCLYCGDVFLADSLRHHLLNSHKENSSITGNREHEYVRRTYHRCRICDKDVLFTFSIISMHTKRFHKMTFHEYDNAYAVFTDSNRLTGSFDDSDGGGDKTVAVKCDVTNGTQIHQLDSSRNGDWAAANGGSQHVVGSGHFAHSSLLFQPPPNPNLPIARKSRAVVVEESVGGNVHPTHLHPSSLQPLNGTAFKDEEEEIAWYDGNTFLCLQCGYSSRRLGRYERHVRSEHYTEPADFAAFTQRGSSLHRCVMCLTEIYHEMSSIRNHLKEVHDMTLDAYSKLMLDTDKQATCVS